MAITEHFDTAAFTPHHSLVLSSPASSLKLRKLHVVAALSSWPGHGIAVPCTRWFGGRNHRTPQGTRANINPNPGKAQCSPGNPFEKNFKTKPEWHTTFGQPILQQLNICSVGLGSGHGSGSGHRDTHAPTPRQKKSWAAACRAQINRCRHQPAVP